MSVLLALSMVLALAPAAYAADTLPAAVDGVITLTNDVTISDTVKFESEDVHTLDLNGRTLTVGRLDVYETLTVKDSAGGGKITSDGTITVLVRNGDKLTIDGGTFDTEHSYSNTQRTIYNMGTVDMNGGTVYGFTAIYNKAFNENEKFNDVKCNLNGGEVQVKEPGYWAVALMGQGMDEDGNVNNDDVVVNIYDGVKIIGKNGSQGIATNASGGKYAGFTVNMYGGDIEMNGDEGCGMYLPAYGKTNIYGGSVKAEQAIRIAAGDLDITGGVIEGTAIQNEKADLISGGSGGTLGAIVVGKASSGYVGDLTVNISGNAEIKNTATEDGVKPAIVVSDKNMAGSTYAQNTINVNIEDVMVEGDIVKISAITGNTQDGGNTNLNLEGTTVTGDVINQTKAGSLEILGGTVNGNVEIKEGGSVVVEKSTVKGTVNAGTSGTALLMSSTVDTVAGDNVVAVDSTVINGTTKDDVVAMIGTATYTDLATALDEAKDGDTVLLVKDATLASTVKEGVTLRVPATITLTVSGTQEDLLKVMGSQGTIRVEAGAFLDLGSSLKMIGNEDYNINLKTGVVDMKMDLSKRAINLAFKGASAEVPVDKVWTTSMEKSLGTGAKVNPSLDEDSVLTVNGTRFQVANGSTMDNEGTIVVNSLMIISSKGEVTEDGTINVARGGKLEIKEGAASVGDFAGTVNNNGTVAYDGTDASLTGTIAMGSGGVVYSQSDISSQLTGRIKALGSMSYAPYDVNNEEVGASETYANAWSYKKSSSSSSSSSGSSATEEEYKITLEDVENGTVKTSPKEAAAGDEVTITVNPDSGYVLDKIRVEDKDGDKVKLTEGEDGKYTFEMPEGGVTISVTFAEETAEEEEETVESVNPFVDVLETAYYYKAVLWAVENGVTSGTSEITFSPSMPCDRGQMATFLWNLAGRPAASGSNPFVDVTADQYYYTAVLWAVDQGITSGTSDNTFSPAKPCSRAEMATFLWNMAGRPAATGSNPFVDVTTSDYYYNAVLWAAETGVTAGTGSNTFSPAQTCSRGEMATFLYNYAS